MNSLKAILGVSVASIVASAWMAIKQAAITGEAENGSGSIIGEIDLAFYCGVWCIAFICGLLRTLADSDYRNLRNCFSVGALSGFAGLGVVCFYVRDGVLALPVAVQCMGIAIAVGMMGKEGTQLLTWILKSALEKIGVNANFNETRNQPKS